MLFMQLRRAPMERQQVAKAVETPAEDGAKPVVKKHSDKVGRNDPCPCGSGKKYKNCCGRPKGVK